MGRSHHAPGNGSPCRLDVLKPAPPQCPQNEIHLAGDHTAVGKPKPERSLAEFFTVSFSQVVRYLGVLLDSELTFSHHIEQVCHSGYYQLWQLRVIARSLTLNAAVSLVHAFAFGRLDYCSSIFAGLPGSSVGEVEAGSPGCGATL